MSRFEDPEPTNAFPASLARGRLHALSIDELDAKRIEDLIRPRLGVLHERWKHRIENPRNEGYAVAFDVADTATLQVVVLEPNVEIDPDTSLQLKAGDSVQFVATVYSQSGREIDLPINSD